GVDHGRALAALDLHRDDLLPEAPAVDGVDRLAVRLERELVGVLAADTGLVGGVLRVAAHVAALERAIEAVADQPVDELLVAEFHTAAVAEQVVRRVRHRLHAACDHDLRVTGPDRLGRQHDRLQAGAAHAAHGHRADGVRHATPQRCLPRRRLAQARRDHVAEDHVLDVRGVDAAALQRCADRDRTELGCLETRKSAEKAADRRARRSHDHGRALRIRHIYGLLLLLFAFCELGPRATGPGTASDYRET